MGSASFSYSGNRATKTSSDGWTGAVRTSDLGDPTSSTIELTFPAVSTGDESNFFLGLAKGTHTVYDECMLDYGIYFYEDDARLLNNCTTVNTQSYTASDVFKMEIASTNIKYYKNDVLVYTDSTTVPSDTYYGCGGCYYTNKYGELVVGSATSSGLLNPPQVAWI